MVCACHRRYEEWIGKVFGKYGAFVGRNKKTPWIILIVCVTVNVALTLGLLKIETLSNIEELYAPRNSEASKNRDEVRKLFSNTAGKYFNQHALSDFGLYGELIIRTVNDENLLNQTILSQIRNIDQEVRREILVEDSSNRSYNFSDICAVFENVGCVVGGSIIFEQDFQRQLNNITYPYFTSQRIAGVFGNVIVQAGTLQSASLVKLRYNLRDDTEDLKSLARKWEKAFEDTIPNIYEHGLEISFIHSDSRNTELAKSTTGDIKYFSVTFTLMITYASLASIGLNFNCIAWRPILSLGGVLATVLAIGSALGFTSLIGIKFVSIVGVMPFLVIGIGLDDVFVLLSGMSDAAGISAPEDGKSSIERKLHYALKSSGVAITITSLTDFLAFAIGGSSVFLSVRNFCITTGIAVLFCYLNQLFLFVPCIAINERRVEGRRHFLVCCRKVHPKQETEGRSSCSVMCCSGGIPEKRDEYDGPLEKYPKLLIKAIVRELPFKICILIIFAGYLGISIYGAINLKQGLELRNLATTDSYYYKFSTLDRMYFREEIPVYFTIREQIEYSKQTNQDKIMTFLQRVKREDTIVSNFEIDWLSSFKASPHYNNANETIFASSLLSFLRGVGSIFQTDISFGTNGDKILASRFYVLTNNIQDSTEQGEMMKRMRTLASESGLQMFAYAPSFIFFEQYVQILTSTLQTVGIAVAVMVIITTAFMPQGVLIVFVFLTMVMILTGIFGFMYFWDLTLSSVTMIHLVMTVGFSVDFSAHICHAYISVAARENEPSTRLFCKAGTKSEREVRVEKSIDRSGGPIINAALSSVVGILMLLLSTSYIFQSFFKLMLLVILFGLLHSVFLLPVLLSFLGPKSGECSKHVAPEAKSRKFSDASDISNRRCQSQSPVSQGPSYVAYPTDFSLGHEMVDQDPGRKGNSRYSREFDATIYSYG